MLPNANERRSRGEVGGLRDSLRLARISKLRHCSAAERGVEAGTKDRGSSAPEKTGLGLPGAPRER